MINGDTTQSVYKRKALLNAKTSAMTTPLKVNLHNPMDKTFITSNTYVRDEKEFLLSKQFRKAKIKGRFSITQHMNKDVIFNDYDAQNKNYTNLILLSQQKRSLRKETSSTPDINNTSCITNNDIQTVVHRKGKLSSYIINPKKKQHSIIKPSKSTETLKGNPLRKERMKHKNNSQYTIHIPGGVFNSRSRSKRNFNTPYRPPNATASSVSVKGVYMGMSPYEKVVVSSPMSYATFSAGNANLTPLKSSSEKAIEVMKGSNSGGKVDFIRKFEFYDYIKKYKIKKVLFIQKFYKERYAERYKKVVLIQSFIRMFLSRQCTENYIKQFYFFLAGLNHLETVAKGRAKLREVFYRIKITAMLNAEYAAYMARYNKGRKEQLQSIYKKMSREVDTTNEKLKNRMFSNVKIEKEVSAFNLNGKSEDIFEKISLKHKRPIKRKIVDDIDEAAKEVESEILIRDDVEISKLRNKRRQPTETISSQMNTEDNLQSDVDRSKRFKSRKVSKGALTIDSGGNISLINKMRSFDVNCFEISHEEVDVTGRKKENYVIESIDITIEESQSKKKVLKSRRKPQSNNKYKITSQSISLYSDSPTEESINKVKEKLNKDKIANISIEKKNISLCFKNIKRYANEGTQTEKTQNKIISLSSFEIESSPQAKQFDILKPQYHKNTLYIESSPKTPSFNQKKFKTKSTLVLSFLGDKQNSFDFIKPSKAHKISLSYHNKSFSSLSPSHNFEITIEQSKRKLIDGSPMLHTNNNLSISSGLNAMELITESNKDSNSDDGNKDEALPIPSNRSLLNRAYNKYFSDLVGNETEGNKSVRTNNNVSIVSIDNYIMYNMNIVSSSFELIASMSNEKLYKAILPVRIVDVIKRTVGKDVIDCIAERPKEELKAKRNCDDSKKKSLLKATRRQCGKPLKKGFDKWKREVMRRELYEKIKEGKMNEIYEKKCFKLSYYDNRELSCKEFSIKYPVKLSYCEDRTVKDCSFMKTVGLSYKEDNEKKNDELDFRHLGGISFYEDKRESKKLSFKKVGRLSYKENMNSFDERKLSFKQPVSLSYKENKNGFDEDNLSFKQPVSLSYKNANYFFNEETISFKKPVSLSYSENNNQFNEETMSFKHPVSLSYKESNTLSQKQPLHFNNITNNNNNQISTNVIKCSYNDKCNNNNNIIDKYFSYTYPSKLSYYESSNIPMNNESHPVHLSYNSHSSSDFSLKHVSSLSYNELPPKLTDSHQLSLSFHDESSEPNIPPSEEPPTKKKLLKSRRRPNKPKQPTESPKEDEKTLPPEEDDEDDKAFLTVRQKQIVKLKSRRKSYPIQQIFIRRIFFRRWKALAPYSPRTIIIRQQRIKRTIQRFPSCSYHDILSYLNLRHCFNKWKKIKSSSFITIHNIHVIVANVERQNLHYIETCFNRWKALSLNSSSRKLSYSPRTESESTPTKGIRVKLVQKEKTSISKTINVKYSNEKKKPKSLNISNKSDKKYKEMKITKKYVPVNSQNMDKIILFDSSVGETSALKEQLRKLREIVLKMVKHSSFMKWRGKDKREIKLRLLDEFSSNNRRLVKYFILFMVKKYGHDSRSFKELSDEKYTKGVAMMIWYTQRKKSNNVITVNRNSFLKNKQ